jgi:hypothetical protein
VCLARQKRRFLWLSWARRGAVWLDVDAHSGLWWCIEMPVVGRIRHCALPRYCTNMPMKDDIESGHLSYKTDSWLPRFC